MFLCRFIKQIGIIQAKEQRDELFGKEGTAPQAVTDGSDSASEADQAPPEAQPLAAKAPTQAEKKAN